MTKKIFVAIVALVTLCASATDVLSFVDPFIGTATVGHTTPAAAYPMGLMQPGPQTGNFNWRYTAGYNYNDTTILGFTQNKLSGMGCSDLGDILIMPFAGSSTTGDFSSYYDKSSEVAKPGYYAINLTQNQVKAEMTATERVALLRFTYGDNNGALLINYQSGQCFTPDNLAHYVHNIELYQIDDYTVVGNRTVANWIKRTMGFAIRFDHPIVSADTLASPDPRFKAPLIRYHFNLRKGETLMVKTSVTTTDYQGALANIAAELPHWDFNRVIKDTQNKWRNLLSQIKIEGTHEQKRNFYTALYHLYFQPNNTCDALGHYRGPDGKTHYTKQGKQYSTLSLWDTFRAAQPLLSILQPATVSQIVNSAINFGEEMGFLPMIAVWNVETYAMIGNHAVPVIVDACLRDVDNIDHERAYRIIKKSLTISHRNNDWTIYDRYGYYPFDIIKVESVSRTLESCYDDYCAALLAQRLGYEADYNFFLQRANYYKNLFDESTGLMRPKDSQGNWREPFDHFALSHATTHGGDYTEGNAWQYTWHVLHDVPGLIALEGGNERFCNKLDSLFMLNETSAVAGTTHDVTGLIGQYAHGNEPSHHVAYLYALAGKPHNTAEIIRQIFDRFYSPSPDGLCGNDDCGQMSAWYIFSALGFYPVDPVNGKYVLGAPQIPEATILLPNGNTLIIKAKNLSKSNKYVSHITLDGAKVSSPEILWSQLREGGTLVFHMTATH